MRLFLEFDMDFSTAFFCNSLLAAVFAFFFFGLPGLLTGLLLGLRANLSILFIAPALGLCAFGPFSLLFTWLLGYSTFTVSAAWIFFQVGTMLIYLLPQKNSWATFGTGSAPSAWYKAISAA